MAYDGFEFKIIVDTQVDSDAVDNSILVILYDIKYQFGKGDSDVGALMLSYIGPSLTSIQPLVTV